MRTRLVVSIEFTERRAHRRPTIVQISVGIRRLPAWSKICRYPARSKSSSAQIAVDAPEKFYRVMRRRFERSHCEAASAELFSAAVSRGDTLKYISRRRITAAQKCGSLGCG